MKDLLVVVRDASLFHRLQMSSHREHYAPWMSVRMATFLNRLPAYVFFNAGVRSGCGQLFKYGVIEQQHLINDCLQWSSLYAAGRLHKPVLRLNDGAFNNSIDDVLQTNRVFALRAALLLNNGECRSDLDWNRIFKYIINLSYHGDVRMGFAEHPSKIENILAEQEDLFYSIYRPLLPNAISNLSHLPQIFKPGNTDPKHISVSCQRVVQNSSISQTIKGIFTASPTTTITYVLRKIKKRLNI